MKNPILWRRIAIGLGILNVAGFGQALGVAEPVHAGIHAVLALAFGAWAWALGRGAPARELPADLQADVQSLADEVGSLRQELAEAQERLDFTERLLAQEREVRRVEPDR